MPDERGELERQLFDCLRERLVRYEGLKALALLVGERIAARDADGANSLLFKQQEYIAEIRAIEEKEAVLRHRLKARFGVLPELSLEEYLLGNPASDPTALTAASLQAAATAALKSELKPGKRPSAEARAREDFRQRLAEANGKIATVLESLLKITSENETSLRASLAHVQAQLLDLQKAKAAQRAYRGSGLGGRPESRFVDKKR